MVAGEDVCGPVYSAQLTEATKAAWGEGAWMDVLTYLHVGGRVSETMFV